MHDIEFLIVLLLAIALLAQLAGRLQIPYPVFLVAGGLAIALAVVVEGESLVNDGIGLTLYRTAVGAATAGTFALESAAVKLVLRSRSASKAAGARARCCCPRRG